MSAKSPMPSSEQVEVWFKDMVDRIQHEPKHSHEPESPITHVLNVARRNGTVYQPKHCGCVTCRHGFTHIAGTAL